MSHIAAYAEIPHGRRYAILLNFKNLSDSFELDSMLDIANLRIIFEAEVVQVRPSPSDAIACFKASLEIPRLRRL